MSTRIYARTNTVPEGCDYITPGKAYEVVDDRNSDLAFDIIDDALDRIVCC